jgi:hypothetical protein
MILPMLKELYIFSVCAKHFAQVFDNLLFYITVCLQHIFSFRHIFIRCFYPGSWVLIFVLPCQGGAQYRHSVGERL